MHQWTRSALIQITACRLDSTKPLSEPMLTYIYKYQLDPKEFISMKFYLKFKNFHSRKCIWTCRQQNGGHFVQGGLVNQIGIELKMRMNNYTHMNLWHIITHPCPNFNHTMAVQLNCHLTHWGRDKMDAILQTTFSSAFPWMKMFKYRLKFHWILFLRVKLTIFQHWFR